MGIPSQTHRHACHESTLAVEHRHEYSRWYSRWQDRHRPQRRGEDDTYFDRLSTRLPILSRITEPTEGQAEIHGRVGSLLEVGTGFHPELTGRRSSREAAP